MKSSEEKARQIVNYCTISAHLVVDREVLIQMIVDAIDRTELKPVVIEEKSECVV